MIDGDGAAERPKRRSGHLRSGCPEKRAYATSHAGRRVARSRPRRDAGAGLRGSKCARGQRLACETTEIGRLARRFWTTYWTT